MSMTLNAYAYLCTSWFIFTFKVGVMFMIGCNNVHYRGSLLIKRNKNKKKKLSCTVLLRYVNISVSAIAPQKYGIYSIYNILKKHKLCNKTHPWNLSVYFLCLILLFLCCFRHFFLLVVLQVISLCWQINFVVIFALFYIILFLTSKFLTYLNLV